jgi:hypothetical protein
MAYNNQLFADLNQNHTKDKKLLLNKIISLNVHFDSQKSELKRQK